MSKNTAHPRDRNITIYGRKPVLEALQDRQIELQRIFLDRNAKGELITEIIECARTRAVELKRCDGRQVSRISRNGRQDQGVAADVNAPNMSSLEAWISTSRDEACLFLIDGVTTPANVGMLIRSLTAAGCDGLILPRKGAPSLSPLVIKSSAGVALKAPIIRCSDALSAVRALGAAGFTVYGLRAEGAKPFYRTEFKTPCVWVLGNEATGVSPAVGLEVSEWIRIPMANGVESLNVSHAGAIVGFELARRQSVKNAPTGA